MVPVAQCVGRLLLRPTSGDTSVTSPSLMREVSLGPVTGARATRSIYLTPCKTYGGVIQVKVNNWPSERVRSTCGSTLADVATPSGDMTDAPPFKCIWRIASGLHETDRRGDDRACKSMALGDATQLTHAETVWHGVAPSRIVAHRPHSVCGSQCGCGVAYSVR